MQTKEYDPFVTSINGVIKRFKEENHIDVGGISDTFHTFDELYHHRAFLFASIVILMPEKCWKSKLHDDGTMYDGMFIVGMATSEGSATYHYDIDPYWDLFKCDEVPNAPKFDGHTPDDAINRIYNECVSTYKNLTEFDNENTETTDFSTALRLMRAGYLVKRFYWDDRVIGLMPGYPDGIDCNAATAKVWRTEEGTKIHYAPYFQMRDTKTNTHYNYTPSTEDLLAMDWVVVVKG